MVQDVAHVAAHILAGKGKHGFDDKYRGQMMVVTGTSLPFSTMKSAAELLFRDHDQLTSLCTLSLVIAMH